MDLSAYRDPEFPMDHPEMLVLMKFVQDFPVEPQPCPDEEIPLRGLRNMWANQYVRFKADLDQRDAEWLAYKANRLAPASVPSEWKGEGPCPICKREAVPVVEDLTEWQLEELIEGLVKDGPA